MRPDSVQEVLNQIPSNQSSQQTRVQKIKPIQELGNKDLEGKNAYTDAKRRERPFIDFLQEETKRRQKEEKNSKNKWKKEITDHKKMVELTGGSGELAHRKRYQQLQEQSRKIKEQEEQQEEK